MKMDNLSQIDLVKNRFFLSDKIHFSNVKLNCT
jgi:hypothetical protein